MYPCTPSHSKANASLTLQVRCIPRSCLVAVVKSRARARFNINKPPACTSGSRSQRRYHFCRCNHHTTVLFTIISHVFLSQSRYVLLTFDPHCSTLPAPDRCCRQRNRAAALSSYNAPQFRRSHSYTYVHNPKENLLYGSAEASPRVKRESVSGGLHERQDLCCTSGSVSGS